VRDRFFGTFKIERKTERKETSSEMLARFEAEVEIAFYPGVTVDEIWVLHFELETKANHGMTPSSTSTAYNQSLHERARS
jgi:hypothetical protein